MLRYERKCLCCGKEVGPAMILKEDRDDDFQIPPNGALAFVSHGNFGSAVFDRITGCGRLEIYICDECISKPKGTVYYVEPQPFKRENLFVEIFDPKKHGYDYNEE